MNPADAQADRLLDAFRYVAGEMAAEERLRFESRLADDQADRDAVADAVLLWESIAATPAAAPPVRLAPQLLPRPSTPPTTQLLPRRPLVILATSLLLVLAVAAVGPLVRRPKPQPELSASRSAPEANLLISVWSNLGAAAESSAATGSEAVAVSVTGAESSDDAGGSEISVPDWLLSAVATGADSDAGPPATISEDQDEEEQL